MYYVQTQTLAKSSYATQRNAGRPRRHWHERPGILYSIGNPVSDQQISPRLYRWDIYNIIYFPCITMSFAVLFLSSCFAAIGLIWAIQLYHSVTTRLSDIPGPPAPSYFVGNVQDLSRAPMGTKMNAWTKEYGHTYKIRGALMVRFS